MAKQNPFVTEEQWIRLEPWRPTPKPSAKGGRKPRGNRAVFDRIIWLLRSGASWNDLANQYPSASTCWPRLQQWEEQDVWPKIWPKFLSELDQRGQLDWEETFAAGSFTVAKKGPRRWKNQRRTGDKVDSVWCLADRSEKWYRFQLSVIGQEYTIKGQERTDATSFEEVEPIIWYGRMTPTNRGPSACSVRSHECCGTIWWYTNLEQNQLQLRHQTSSLWLGGESSQLIDGDKHKIAIL